LKPRTFRKRFDFDDILSPRQGGMLFPLEARADAIAGKNTPVFVGIAVLVA